MSKRDAHSDGGSRYTSNPWLLQNDLMVRASGSTLCSVQKVKRKLTGSGT
jgi:hypothetical protein